MDERPELKLMQPRVSEAELQRCVLDWCEIRGVFAVRMPLGPVLHRKGKGANVKAVWKKNHLKGFPDIHGVLKRKHRGRAFYLELKAKDGRLSPEQREWLEDLEAVGAACAVVRSLEDLVMVMREWGEI